MKKVKTQSPIHGIRFEGVLLGVGLTLILFGALGMFIPGPAFMPMSRHTHTFSWDAQSSNFVGELYVQMLPSQFAQARLQVEEGGNVSSIVIQVFSNYQALSPVSIRTLIYQAINQTEVNFFLSWMNATHDQPLPFTGYYIRVTGDGPTRITIASLVQWFGDFTYFVGLFLIALAAIPFWGFIILAYLRRHRIKKAEEKNSRKSESEIKWE